MLIRSLSQRKIKRLFPYHRIEMFSDNRHISPGGKIEMGKNKWAQPLAGQQSDVSLLHLNGPVPGVAVRPSDAGAVAGGADDERALRLPSLALGAEQDHSLVRLVLSVGL